MNDLSRLSEDELQEEFQRCIENGAWSMADAIANVLFAKNCMRVVNEEQEEGK